MNKPITKIAAAAVIVIVTAVAIKQVVRQKQQAQSAKRITQYSKDETDTDSKIPNTREYVEKSSADTDKSTLANDAASKLMASRRGRAAKLLSQPLKYRYSYYGSVHNSGLALPKSP
ncbi:MAG: hypothetical protein ACYTF1_17415 [Planctomycetota bacterium]